MVLKAVKKYLSKLREKLKRKVVAPIYEMPMPTDIMKLFQSIQKGLMLEHAEALAKSRARGAKLEKIEEERRKEIEWEKIAKEAIQHYQELAERRPFIFFEIKTFNKKGKAVKLRPQAFLKDDRSFSVVTGNADSLAGFVLLQTEDGGHMWYPVLSSSKADLVKGKEVFVQVEEGARKLEDLFKNPRGIVAQLAGGKYDSSYLWDGINLIISPSRKYYNTTDGTPVKIIDLSDSERAEYEAQIKELREALARLTQEVEELRKKENRYIVEVTEAKSIARSALDLADNYKTMYEAMKERTDELVKRATQAGLTIQDLGWSAMTAEEAFEKAKRSARKMTEEYAKILADPMLEALRVRLLRMSEALSKAVTRITAARIEAGKPSKEEETGE